MRTKVLQAAADGIRFLRARVRVLCSPEKIAAGVVVLVLGVGPAAVFGYARWVDRGVITVHAQQWAYRPNTIYLKEGVPVRLRIVSEDVVHGFTIDGIPVKISGLVPGKAEYVSFTPEKPGTYYYRCTTYCALFHWKMTGQIIVTGR